MSIAGVLILPGLLNQASFLRLGRAALATIVMAAGVLAVRTLGLPVQVLAGIAMFSLFAIVLRAVAVDEIRNLYSAVRRRRSASATA